MDQLLATGEQVTIALMAMALHAQGHEAISFTGGQIGLVTDNAFSKVPASNPSTSNASSTTMLNAGKIVIIAGFQGITATGDFTTLGRGGSNATLVAVGRSIKCERLRKLYRCRRHLHRRPAHRKKRPQNFPHLLRRDA